LRPLGAGLQRARGDDRAALKLKPVRSRRWGAHVPNNAGLWHNPGP
jgi:hypothetical protein